MTDPSLTKNRLKLNMPIGLFIKSMISENLQVFFSPSVSHVVFVLSQIGISTCSQS